jgi:CubicO group peptidase (beta-lactamase class C family)
MVKSSPNKGARIMGKTAFLVLMVVVLMVPACSPSNPPVSPPQASYWPTQEWRTSTPEEGGFDSAKLSEGLQAMRDEQINIHSLMIILNDKLILDAYFYPYDGSTVHELASVTKSVITTLIGIAADQGKLRLDDKMVSFFPDRTIANRGFLKNQITVRQLASMTSGLDCISANDEQTLAEMGTASDWIQFTLDLKVKHLPGVHFEYCSPGMHLLSAILQEATGMTASEFARINLFEPLGITDFIWESDPQGYSDGWAGLYLHPHEVAKIGYLMLHQGQWEDQQIVSAAWVKEATKLQKKTGRGDNYGYGWWVPPPTQFVEFAAEGRGGQYVRVLPELNLIVVTTGGGFEWNDIVPMLVPAMVNTSGSLPASLASVEQLNTTVSAILQPPITQVVPPLPGSANVISGKTYNFDFSSLDLKTMRWDFEDTTEARLFATFYNQPDRNLVVRMDGVYSMYPIGEHNFLMGMRCSWINQHTLLFEYDGIANHDAYALEIDFEGDTVTIHAKERTHDAILTLEGKLQSQ